MAAEARNNPLGEGQMSPSPSRSQVHAEHLFSGRCCPSNDLEASLLCCDLAGVRESVVVSLGGQCPWGRGKLAARKGGVQWGGVTWSVPVAAQLLELLPGLLFRVQDLGLSWLCLTVMQRYLDVFHKKHAKIPSRFACSSRN